jgi:hypothetical protein
MGNIRWGELPEHISLEKVAHCAWRRHVAGRFRAGGACARSRYGREGPGSGCRSGGISVVRRGGARSGPTAVQFHIRRAGSSFECVSRFSFWKRGDWGQLERQHRFTPERGLGRRNRLRLSIRRHSLTRQCASARGVKRGEATPPSAHPLTRRAPNSRIAVTRQLALLARTAEVSVASAIPPQTSGRRTGKPISAWGTITSPRRKLSFCSIKAKRRL